MRAPSYPAEGQLVAVAGEEIVCPRCSSSLATFTQDLFWPKPFELHYSREAVVTRLRGTEALLFCRCGAQPVRGGEPRIYDGRRPQMHVRSGTWTGWRSIGAE